MNRGSLDEAQRNPGRGGKESRMTSGLHRGQVSLKIIATEY
jgi:hypothetical protein